MTYGVVRIRSIDIHGYKSNFKGFVKIYNSKFL